LRKQEVNFNIEQYKQIGYTEWSDYFSKPFIVRSQKHPNTPKRKIKQCKNSTLYSIKEKEILENKQIEERKAIPKIAVRKIPKAKKEKENYSDSDLSFEYDKKKKSSSKRYKNELFEECKSSSEIILNGETDTPEPNPKLDTTPEEQEQLFLKTSSNKLGSTQE